MINSSAQLTRAMLTCKLQTLHFIHKVESGLIRRIAIVGFLAYAAVTPWHLQAAKPQADPTARPNVIVILTDDQGWGDLSLHGNPNLQTPNIDSLARDGAQVKNFYVCAVCSPTRAEFLTGRYHSRMGVFSTSAGGERIAANEKTIADAFGSAGYQTAAYGKWHSGMQAPYHPNARGFDDFYGFCSGHWGNYFSPMLEHNGRLVDGDGFIIDDLTTHAIDFVKQHRGESFFVYLPLNTPHSPMQVPEEKWQEFADKEIVPDPSPKNAKAEKLVHTRAALALCENIDDNVGRLLSTLEQTGLDDNTIVVYFCDNGPNGARFNGGLRGRKGSVNEGGLRSPCLIRWPARIAGGTEVDSVVGAIDLYPTLAGLAGIETVDGAGPLDGESVAEFLTSERSQDDIDERLIYSAWNGKYSVRSQRFRYHAAGELFEIDEDFGENNDVAAMHKEVAEDMAGKLDQWVAEVKPRGSRSVTEVPFPVGYPGYEWTQMPARDCTATGAIQRSNKYPNSSYMGNWTRSEDYVDWMVDVIEAGRFSVEMRYACPESAVGTELTLAFIPAGQTTPAVGGCNAEVEEANDTSVVGKQFDRFPRVEGYDKDWASMSLGELSLPKGPGTLRLRCPEIVGDAGIEMRLLMLRRIGMDQEGNSQ